MSSLPEEHRLWRQQGIGASDAPVIAGTSPWKTKKMLYDEKVYGKDSQPDNPSMERGRKLEEVARQEFEKMMDVEVFPKQVLLFEFPWMRASLDGLSLDQKVMVEIKCPNAEDHFQALNGKVPEKYYAQCQHQLHVMGIPYMYYFSFDGRRGTIVTVKAHETYCKWLFEEEKKFWEEHIMKKNPPNLTPRDHSDMSGNEKWAYRCHRLQRLRELKNKIEVQEEMVKDCLINLAEHSNAEGDGYRLTKSEPRGQIDYPKAMNDLIEQLMEKYPDIEIPNMNLDEYRKSHATRWTFRVA